MINTQVDIKENSIFELSPDLLNSLLKDNTLSTEHEQVNIFWATDSYASRGDGYRYGDRITLEAITGANGNVIVPRAIKSRAEQQQRIRKRAEVFTPSWICNKQNNLVDNAWFAREDVFNTEIENPDGTYSWIVNPEPIVFPEGKTWHDYVNSNRLEMACGEAPYLASRYDAVTGESIPVERRIGMLDRKLRVVGENTDTIAEWLEAAQAALMSIYGYEWQGDNIVLARESLLYTFIDFYRAKFGEDPQLKSLHFIAEIIAWNIWQMDGLKCVIPNSCHSERQTIQNLFESTEVMRECEGCRKNDFHKHNGIYCLIKDWKENEILTFVSLLKDKWYE